MIMKKYGSKVIKGMRAHWKKEKEFEDKQFTGKDI